MKAPKLLRTLESKLQRHLLIISGLLFRWGMHSNGWWRNDLGFQFDVGLSNKMIEILNREGCKSVIDLGCGRADYLKELKFAGMQVHGFDGNIKTVELTGGLGQRADLTYPLPPLPKTIFGYAGSADWCICIGVGHFIPMWAEDQFMLNIHKVYTKGLILSWDIPGTFSPGACNEKTPEEIKRLFVDKFRNNLDIVLTTDIRRASMFYSDSLYVFRKP